MAKNSKKCNFCGKSEKEVNFLINGLEANICDVCGLYAADIIQEIEQDIEEKSSVSFHFDKKPKDIVHYLDQYVIGQEYAKKVLSVAVYNHYKRISQVQNSKNEHETIIEKSNILLIGHTGTGKTLLAKSIAHLLNVPFAIADATTFTQSGYVGEDIESVISRLLQNCEFNIPKAEKGIVFIDEIDKIARKGENPSITRDVGGEGVQQGLLKLLEGSEVLVPPQGGRKHPEQPMLKVDTKNILFICGGAFDGLEQIVANRMNKSTVGFKNQQLDTHHTTHSILANANSLDLKKFGMIPELLGRIPVLASLEPMDAQTLKLILTQPKNAILKQYEQLLKMENIQLQFDESAIDFIVEKAMELDLGARGLRSISESIMIDIMYDAPSLATDHIRVDRALAESNYYKYQPIKKTA